MATSKEKLDSLLGISEEPGKTMDDFLNEINLDDGSAENTMSIVNETIKDAITEVDSNITNAKISSDVVSTDDLIHIKQNLDNISELISVSKSVIKHLYENIISTDLIDTELVNAAASFIEVAHRNTKEYIDMYRERLRAYDKIQMENIQFQHKKELIEYKHKLDLEKINAKSIDAIPEGSITYSQEDITRMLNENDLDN